MITRKDIDKDEAIEADARRFRWLLNGNGYFLEENYLRGGPTEADHAEVREAIDEEMEACRE